MTLEQGAERNGSSDSCCITAETESRAGVNPPAPQWRWFVWVLTAQRWIQCFSGGEGHSVEPPGEEDPPRFTPVVWLEKVSLGGYVTLVFFCFCLLSGDVVRTDKSSTAS